MAKPKNVVELSKSHRSVAEKKRRENEQAAIAQDNDDLLTPPAWLTDAYAKKEWKRVVPKLIKMDIIGDLDFGALAGYCNAFAEYRRATIEMKKHPRVIEDDRGKLIENPYCVQQRFWGEQMMKFGDKCGMTISSRLKAATKKVERQEAKIEERFGAI